VDRTTLIIRAHWRNRRETAAEGGVRLAKALAAHAEIRPASFSRWFKQSSRKPSFQPFCAMPPDPTELASILERGIQYKDVSGEPWPEMGFSANAWNGGAVDSGSASFRATIGACDTVQAGFNQFDLEVKDVRAKGSLVSTEIVRAVVDALIDAMEPDCLDVAPIKWLFGAKESTCPAGGWMSYVRNPLGHAIAVPAEVRVKSEGGGLLMVATTDTFSDADPIHIARANALNEALVEARARQAAAPST
jgi:hypothetical protein